MGVIYAREADGATGIGYATSANDLRRVLASLASGRTTRVPTPAPTPTPIPTRPSARDGKWVYWGPDCPGGYANCNSEPYAEPFVTLDAEYGSPIGEDSPYLIVGCSDDGRDYISVFDAGGLLIGGSDIQLLGKLGDPSGAPTEWWDDAAAAWAYDWSDDLTAVYPSISTREVLVGWIQEAEDQRAVLSVGAVNEEGVGVLAVFDTAGATRNFNRLSCGR